MIYLIDQTPPASIGFTLIRSGRIRAAESENTLEPCTKTTFSCHHNDMHSQEAIQALIEARLAGLREASESRDVDALMSWHAKDAVFTDVGTEAEPLTQ